MNVAPYFTVPSGVGANLLERGQALLARYVPKAQELLAKVAPAQEAPAETVPEEHPGALVEPSAPSGLDAVPAWAKIGLALGALYVLSNALGRKGR